MRLAGIKDFTGPQGLLRLLFGIFRGDTHKLFCADFDRATMQSECKFGNGPISSVIGLWDRKKDVLQGIQWLVANADREFKRLRLPFPY
eukprot:SAG22_NODE_8673_length_637_cov_1.633829_1_plen_88_part_10